MKINKTVHISDIKQLITKDQQDSIKRYSVDPQQQHYNIILTIRDARDITDLQRKKIYALLRDISNHIEGYNDKLHIAYYKDLFKFKAYQMNLIEDYTSFSFSNCNLSEANTMIELILKVMFKFNISMEYETSKMLKDEFIYNFMCLKYRKCVVCGGAADIHHHSELVGMGSDRNKHNHSNSELIALCRKHHTEAHTIGLNKFVSKYKIKPIKLNESQIKELGL